MTAKTKAALPRRMNVPRKQLAKFIDDIVDGTVELSETGAWAFMSGIIGLIVLGFMAQATAFVFSKPGLVEWIAQEVFYQNCVRNNICDFNANMAAFSVSVVVGVGFLTMCVMMIRMFTERRTDDTTDALTRIENTATYAIERINELEKTLERRDVLSPDADRA